MAINDIVANAAAAESTRVDGPPAPEYTPSAESQERIQAIRADKDFYAVGTEKQKSLAKELHAHITGAGLAPQARPGETENQKEIRLLNESGKLMSPDPTVRATAMKELRERLAAESTDAEREAIGNAPLPVLREQAGVDPNRVLPALRPAWNEEAEGDILGAMAIRGVPGRGRPGALRLVRARRVPCQRRPRREPGRRGRLRRVPRAGDEGRPAGGPDREHHRGGAGPPRAATAPAAPFKTRMVTVADDGNAGRRRRRRDRLVRVRVRGAASDRWVEGARNDAAGAEVVVEVSYSEVMMGRAA